PSRGRPQAGFAHLRPPLMSNVSRQQAAAMFTLRSRFALILLFVGSLWLSFSVQGQVPNPTGRITDQAAVLSAEDNLLLAQMLANYERETTHQIGVLTVLTLAGEPIELFSLRTAKAWAL